MKILEELKAAQAIIDADTKGGHFDLNGGDYIDVNDEEGSREVAAVLRRIPQLIEVVEMIEAKAKEEPWIDYRQGRHPGEVWKLGVDNGEISFARELLTKLNGSDKR